MMQVFSRIGLISAVSVVGLLGRADAAWAQQPEAPPHALVAAATGVQFHVNDAAGRFLALHFLTKTDTPESVAFVNDYVRQASTVAGVVHVFAKPDDAATVKAWAAQFGSEAGRIFIDEDSTLAKDFKVADGLSINGVQSTYPATIVLGPDGKELFRHAGKSRDDYLSFAVFTSQLTAASRHPALADYNLPTKAPLAVEGYDVVAYFTQNKAVKGRPELVSVYRGVTYRFASGEDRRLFATEPEKYLPTYGGWCATAMGSTGTKVEIDPTNFKVKGGRLFLFYKSLLSDALKDWNKHESEWEPAADRNWQKLTKEEPVRPVK